jgi:hypothetical protein
MCGNPRKYFGEVTMQEKKANQAWLILWTNLPLEAV